MMTAPLISGHRGDRQRKRAASQLRDDGWCLLNSALARSSASYTVTAYRSAKPLPHVARALVEATQLTIDFYTHLGIRRFVQ